MTCKLIIFIIIIIIIIIIMSTNAYLLSVTVDTLPYKIRSVTYYL
jgi:hypothetical protein